MSTAEVCGVKLGYIDTGGDGTPVVLLNAFPFHRGMWEPQIEALSDRFRFIAPDLKGFGESDAPDDPAAYSMDSFAAEVRGLLDHIGVADYVLVGLSMGGYIAFSMLRDHPQGIKALVLADSRADVDPPEGKEKRTAQQQTVRESGTGALIPKLVKALLSHVTHEKKDDVVKRVTALMDNPAAGFIGALEAMKNRPDSTDDLVKVAVPTLVMVGENDAVTPPEAARKVHEHIGGSRLVVIPEAGHISNIETPEAFNGALAEFLSELG